VQLRHFLNKDGINKINIIAINWSEERYGKPSKKRLNNLVKSIHPMIRVIHSNQEIEKYFSPLTAVPINFIFDQQGQLIYGKGNQGYLGTDEISKILKRLH